MRRLLALFALAGCDKILGLDYHEPIDAPAAGHDEDLDGVADADDTCPAVRNDQGADADKDRVGDACDPNPGIADQIGAFYAFVDAEQPMWMRVSGTWAFVEDQLRLDTPPIQNAPMFARFGPSVTPPYVVEVHFTLTSIDTVSSFSVTANLDDAAVGVACTLMRNFQNVDVVQVYTPGTKNAQVAAIRPNDGYTARLRIDATTATCDMAGDDAAQGGTATEVFGAPRAGYVGFEARNLTARADYMIVYTRR